MWESARLPWHWILLLIQISEVSAMIKHALSLYDSGKYGYCSHHCFESSCYHPLQWHCLWKEWPKNTSAIWTTCKWSIADNCCLASTQIVNMFSRREATIFFSPEDSYLTVLLHSLLLSLLKAHRSPSHQSEYSNCSIMIPLTRECLSTTINLKRVSQLYNYTILIFLKKTIK